jgi:transposase
MAKYSLETKLKAVNDVLELGMSSGAVAKLLNTDKSVVRRWVTRYEELGVEGLSMKSGTYSGDFKVRVVQYIHENGASLFSAAVHFGIPSQSTVSKWERIYWEEGPQALYKDNRGRKRKMPKDKIQKPKMDKKAEEDLMAEVQRLRMENEYLKKLNALVQAREKSAKKTK